MRISQAGLDWSKRKFIIISVIIGVALFGAVYFAADLSDFRARRGVCRGFGFPRWLLAYLKKRRENAFLHNFPDAVDVIVRGVKAGLPLGDCLRIIATESPGAGAAASSRPSLNPQTIGIPMGDAVSKLYERMPLPEANFFGIVIAIQQKAGGNLSEALGNLSQGAARPQDA